MEKICCRCKLNYDISNFTTDKNTKDGYYPVCKMCRRKYNVEFVHRPEIKKKKNSYQKEYTKLPHVKEKIREYQRTIPRKIYSRKWQSTEEGRKKCRKATNKYRKTEYGKQKYKEYLETHKKYKKATQAILYDIRIGKRVKAIELKCYYCNNQANNYHHYKGYLNENIRNVIPVCIKCHNFIHTIYRFD